MVILSIIVTLLVVLLVLLAPIVQAQSLQCQDGYTFSRRIDACVPIPIPAGDPILF